MILVTGGAGFIGSHVAEQLIAKKKEVVILDDLSGGFLENIPNGARFVKGSVTDEGLLDGIFNNCKVEHIFHLAAYAAEGLSHFIRKFNYTNNLIGSINLINRAVKYEVKTFVFTSSIAVYGPAQTPMTETTTPCPEDPYGVSKYAIELDLEAAHKMFGLNYIVFRPHNVYGVHQNLGDPYRNVIGIFMNQIMKKEPITVFGDGEQTRAFTYIDDISPIIAQSIENPLALNEVFNIGADIPYTINKLAEVVCESFGVPVNKIHLPPRNEVINAFSDHSKVKKVFNVEPKWSLEDGIKAMTAWAKKVGAKKSKPFTDIEIKKNMPPSWQRICE
jgi:UDP-glucose 4-epimerase